MSQDGARQRGTRSTVGTHTDENELPNVTVRSNRKRYTSLFVMGVCFIQAIASALNHSPGKAMVYAVGVPLGYLLVYRLKIVLRPKDIVIVGSFTSKCILWSDITEIRQSIWLTFVTRQGKKVNARSVMSWGPLSDVTPESAARQIEDYRQAVVGGQSRE